MQPFNIGLIGFGTISRTVHLNILLSLPGVKLIAIAESNAQNREQALRFSPSTRTFSDYEALLKEPTLDAVVICLPNTLHARAAILAFEYRKHVYLEKPLAIHLNDARKVLTAWRKAGVTGMMGFNFRFHKLHQSARSVIQSGRLGDLIRVRSVFSTTSRDIPDWKTKRQTGGGVLLDLASHHIDLIHFYLENNISTVFAEIHSEQTEDDNAKLQLQLKNGLMITSDFSRSGPDEDSFEFCGAAGSLFLNRLHSWNIEIRRPEFNNHGWTSFRRLWSSMKSPYLMDKILAPNREPSYRAALTAFVKAARLSQSIRPDLEDGYQSLLVIHAAEESARTGKAVELSEFRKNRLSQGG
jgi:myo-inositol 2-dehydrogenase / D-chiro-inositol 1-dehydrogenase